MYFNLKSLHLRCLCCLFSAKNCMATSDSKGRFFLQNESIRIDSHNESNRIDSNRDLECSTQGRHDGPTHRSTTCRPSLSSRGIRANTDGRHLLGDVCSCCKRQPTRPDSDSRWCDRIRHDAGSEYPAHH